MKQDLPLPVRQYFRYAIQNDRMIRSATIFQQGELRMGEGKKWMKFEARQFVATSPRRFHWDAIVRMLPFLSMNVRDAYDSGAASMELRIFSIPVSRERNVPQMNSGALQRYLGEAVWVPTALFPNNELSWKHIDQNTSLVSLTDSSTESSLNFRFNDRGEVTEVFTPGRFRKADGRYVLTPWRVETGHYREFHGFRIPTESRVFWGMPSGDFHWFTVRIIDVKYEFFV